MALVRVRFHDQVLLRETADEMVNACLHCGAERHKVRRGKRWVNRYDTRSGALRARPFFSYDDTNFAFCNRECFAAFWDGLLRQHGPAFRDFVYWLACSGDVPPEALRSGTFLAHVKDLILDALENTVMHPIEDVA